MRTVTRYLGRISLWSDGDVRWAESNNLSPGMTLDELELVFRAVVGAKAANGGESVVRLAASVLAKAGAEKRLREAS